jgi:hypothetical protein
MGGGAISPNDTFAMTIQQLETGATFIPKFYGIPVTLSKAQVQVFNTGPQAVFRLVDSRLQNAALTMSARLAIDLYNEGQSTTRALHVNGFAEALNDGVYNSWDGNTYTTYGTLTRNGTIAAALNSPMTGPSATVSGPITYKLLEEAYNSVCIGDEHPNLIVTTNLGMSYIKEKFQPQWRVETQDPNIGFNGVKFNMAMVIQSQYCPGSAPASGSIEDTLGMTTGLTGEAIFFLNTKYLRLWVTNDPEFGFGFTGFKPAQDTLTVGGQYLFSGNLTVQAPRLMRQLHTVTG